MDFCLFARNMGKNISKNLSSKSSETLFEHAKHSTADAFKTASKRSTQKNAEASDDLTGNKIAGKITRVSETSPQNNSVKSEKDILRERYICPEKR